VLQNLVGVHDVEAGAGIVQVVSVADLEPEVVDTLISGGRTDFLERLLLPVHAHDLPRRYPTSQVDGDRPGAAAEVERHRCERSTLA